MSIDTVFSEFEARQMNFTLDETVYRVECIGSVEEENEVRKTIKKCRGVTKKTRTKGTGAGTLKITAHMPYELYVKLHGMDKSSLAQGVYAYGTQSLHPVVLITALILDEDDVEKFKAWPQCTVSTGPARKIENGAEEVAETEMEISYGPDDNGEGFYEALAASVDEAIASAWMEEWTPALVAATV